MTLLNKNPKKKDIITPAIFDRRTPVNVKKKGLAKDRKPIQANPTSLDLIRRISYAKNIPMYAVLDDMAEFYKEHALNDVERDLFENYVTPKTGKIKK